MIRTHQTAPTQFVRPTASASPIATSARPEECLSSSTSTTSATMDYWDPTVTDGLARDRELILFNNAGVSSSSGEVIQADGRRRHRLHQGAGPEAG